ncbi:uncharacterized protein LOC131324808 isoform X5 [Rhododendron vialii]|uniref:uncharacterized protein LOC131324808 isoform X5 n=1 Tax=Rhododendron vialii TaxID=182163 RepID=UPI00265FA4F2|nr:uncharacterized protein LOC131324808 isoform X5 [Rhododendron vialii]
MAAISPSHDHVEDEEKYVLLDLDGVSGQVHIPPNAPYVLSGLDTLNPILVIDNKVKLVSQKFGKVLLGNMKKQLEHALFSLKANLLLLYMKRLDHLKLTFSPGNS